MPEIAVLIALNVFLGGALLALHLGRPTGSFMKPQEGFWLRFLPVWFLLFSAIIIIALVFSGSFSGRILLK